MIRQRHACPLLVLPLLLLALLLLCNDTASIAIAPSTFGTAIARAGKISNTLKVSLMKDTCAAQLSLYVLGVRVCVFEQRRKREACQTQKLLTLSFGFKSKRLRL